MDQHSTGTLEFKGIIETGVGTGGYYLTIPEFHEQFVRILEADPYPGTLNIKGEGMDLEMHDQLEKIKEKCGIGINGFEKDGETFFPGVVLWCTLSNVDQEGEKSFRGLVVFPEKTVHPPEVVEFVATVRIRDHLPLGAEVILRIEME